MKPNAGANTLEHGALMGDCIPARSLEPTP